MNILRPLGKVFNKGLNEKDKKEGLLKRLKNIEDKKEEQLKMIENKESEKLGIISGINIFDEDLPQKAKTMPIKLNNQEKLSSTIGLTLREIKIWNLILETIGP